MILFYIFIYIFLLPGSGAGTHRCQYPSVHFCLLPRRQEHGIFKQPQTWGSFLSQTTRQALTIPACPCMKTLVRTGLPGAALRSWYKRRFVSAQVEKHHLYSFAAVAFLPGTFPLSVNTGPKYQPHLHYKSHSSNGLQVGERQAVHAPVREPSLVGVGREGSRWLNFIRVGVMNCFGKTQV